MMKLYTCKLTVMLFVGPNQTLQQDLSTRLHVRGPLLTFPTRDYLSEK